MQKNIVELDRPELTNWCMHIACWIHKATDTHSGYVILVFQLQQWLHELSQCYVIHTLPFL